MPDVIKSGVLCQSSEQDPYLLPQQADGGIVGVGIHTKYWMFYNVTFNKIIAGKGGYFHMYRCLYENTFF
jgi:hypothetical protein